jgi:hypothetical protein
VQEVVQHVDAIAEIAAYSTTSLFKKTHSYSETRPPHPSDLLQFGRVWTKIRPFANEGALFKLIAARKKEIQEIKDHWRQKIHALNRGVFCSLLESAQEVLSRGKLISTPSGIGGAYFLVDQNEKPLFVVKPFDEDILCLNNRKRYASPFIAPPYRVRQEIPLYRSHQTDSLSYRIAELLNIPEITPRATFGIFRSEDFYDLSEKIPNEEKENFFQTTGAYNKEKLCSVQEYFSHEQDLVGLSSMWVEKEFSDVQIEKCIDQHDFERANFFIWVLYDCDAHGGNILVYQKAEDSEKKPIYGLKKIDNGLSFPEKNVSLVNLLAYLPNAQSKLSAELKILIFQIPVEQIIEELRKWELETTIEAFVERIEVLQELARRDLSIHEINLRLSALELMSGRELALSASLEDLEELIKQHSTSSQSS